MSSIPGRTSLGQALVPAPTLPSLTYWGWIKTSGVYEPLWTMLSEASKIYRELVSCKCKEDCVKSVSARRLDQAHHCVLATGSALRIELAHLR